MITPVFFGTVDEKSTETPAALEKFKVREPQPKNIHSKFMQGQGFFATMYYLPEEPLAGSLKACLVTINEGEDSQQKVQKPIEEEEKSDPVKDAEKLEKDRKNL